MPPRRPANVLPKPMEVIKLELAQNGKVAGPEALLDVDSKKRKAAFSSLKSSLQTAFPDKFAEYQRLQSDLEKRQWLSAFIIDPASGCRQHSH